MSVQDDDGIEMYHTYPGGITPGGGANPGGIPAGGNPGLKPCGGILHVGKRLSTTNTSYHTIRTYPGNPGGIIPGGNPAGGRA